jgi:hypothetical protein
LVAFVQRKGFYYHFYPAAVISVLLLVVVSVDGLETIGPIRRLLGAPRVVAVHVVVWGLLVLSCAKSIQYWQQRNPPLLSPLIRIAEEHAKGRSILLLSSSIFPSFPLVNYSRVGWSSRFANMWVLPNVYSGVRELEGKFPYHKRSEMDGLERWFVDAVISDMVRSQPVLVICDCSQKKQGFGKTTFDYIEYFLKDQRFAEMWRNYSLLTSVDDYRVFKMKKERVIGVENAAANG